METQMSQMDFRLLTTNEALREYLLLKGEANPYGFWKFWKDYKKVTSYDSILRNFYILRRLGLIETVRWEEGRAPSRKRYYRIVAGMEDDHRWLHPEDSLWPSKS